MDPFKNFNHFISFFLPGVILFIMMLMLLSLLIGDNLLNKEYFSGLIAITLIGASILGLGVDEIRHVLLEERFFVTPWHNEHKISENLPDFVCYVPGKISLDLYKTITEEYFYYYEFDANISIVSIIGSIVVPLFANKFFSWYFANITWLLIIFIVLLGLGLMFWSFAKHGFCYFCDTIVEAIENKEKGFKDSIGYK